MKKHFQTQRTSTCTYYLHQLALTCRKKFTRARSALIVFLLLTVFSSQGAPQWRAIQPVGTGKTGFSLLPPSETGIQFSNVLSDAAIVKNQILLLGSGVALGDVDGDGWCDIYFCRLEGPNVLYRNLGNWRFEDITAAAGVACPDQFSTSALFADVDGDGKLDLLVNSIGGGTRLFLNDGAGHFKEFTEAGLATQFGAMSMAMGDIDGDGDLELYVTNYRVNTFKDVPAGGVQRPQTKVVDGKVVVTPDDRFA